MKTLLTSLLTFLISIQLFSNTFGDDINQFSLALSSKLETEEENVVFSPYSIFTNLSLLYFGAEGQTAGQMKSALHLSLPGNRFLEIFKRNRTDLTKEWEYGYQLTMANALFAHKDHFFKAFESIAQDTYDAKLQSIDFMMPNQALETINEWVFKKTGGKISSILSEQDIDTSTRLVAANACYFQGDWARPFREKMNRIAPFYKEDGTEEETNFLHQLSPFSYYEEDHFQAVSLPFVRHSTDQPFLTCLLLLPKKGTLLELEKGLTPQTLATLIQNNEKQSVDLTVPKFCFSKRLSLNEPLKALGMTVPFTYSADFSKIDGMKDLFLNQVVHQTYFSFHENGVTAAAATASSIGVTATPPRIGPVMEFNANHPFLFMIVDTHSGAILFMGRVLNPQVQECNEN